MSVIQKLIDAQDNQDLKAYNEVVSEDYVWVKHSTGEEIPRDELSKWLISPDAPKSENARIIYENDEIGVAHYFVSFKDGTKFKYEIPIREIRSRFDKMKSRNVYECSLQNNLHVDLLPFFANRSIKGYAFGNAYVDNKLDTVSSALLKKKKVHHDIVNEKGEEKWIAEYTRWELIWYNFEDSVLTMELTTYDNNLVLKTSPDFSRLFFYF